MAAPRHVPLSPTEDSNTYRSPDVVPSSWVNRRPGDLESFQPSGGSMGHQGPDQGYALRLCRGFREQLHIGEHEHLSDVERGCVQIALKRASIFGRAPVVHDLEMAYRVWGFLDPAADGALVAERARLFEGLAESHHYADLRRLVAIVPESTLEMSPSDLEEKYLADWSSLLELT
ncbi:MAG: hypothetical protein CL458_05205 [Acidimicrobiaceae bacterium]|nr:hypothetical protein [Acidimicrobiaceae bacterium]